MQIRKTTIEDLPVVMTIYEQARAYMRETGNAEQWQGNHPPAKLIAQDIEAGTSYVCERDGEILTVFYFNVEEDPTYGKINGAWLSDEPYGVIHRIARSPSGKGCPAFCIGWCFVQRPNIRIDTHKDNEPMLALLDKLGFTCCGVIWLENGDERLAFQKV